MQKRVRLRHQAHFQIELIYVRDGHFTLYEDSGNGWGYEKGDRVTIEFSWSGAAKTLTIGDRQSTFPGMNAEREFGIVWDGAGDSEAKAFRLVVYKANKLAIKA